MHISLTFAPWIFAHEKNSCPPIECGQNLLAVSTEEPKDHIHTYNVTIGNDVMIKDFRHFYRALLNIHFDFKDPSIWNCKINYYMVRKVEDNQFEYTDALQSHQSRKFSSMVQGLEHTTTYAEVMAVEECAVRKGDDNAWKRVARTTKWIHQDLRKL